MSETMEVGGKYVSNIALTDLLFLLPREITLERLLFYDATVVIIL